MLTYLTPIEWIFTVALVVIIYAVGSIPAWRAARRRKADNAG
jgi:ABC-type antimicrobial peptide transport system permease subunit